ncbi:hypothetical protein ETP1_002 [Edwardsiella phage ETP-1]|uniref:Uncharacterized protein n=1 Tax=Edwardsiella phage ETP-1 TaxID=2544920 RepID=A0A6G5P4B5_9CAUD|nr:hypothetical protein ETP1_002 [Edwardsiella phage ETP-1]
MTIVKKQFADIFAILEANQSRKVSTIMPQLLELMQAKGGCSSDTGRTFLKDDEGNTYAVFCYYHKRWELTNTAEYGAKGSTATGLNTMCKEGANAWAKQQRVYKKLQQDLLTLIAGGQLTVEEMQAQLADAEEARRAIVPRADGHGFEAVDEVTK